MPHHTNPVILGIPESKLNGSVSDQEVNLNGYNNRNRNRIEIEMVIEMEMAEVLLATPGQTDLCFNNRNIFSNSIEHFFSTFLLQE